MKKNLRTQPVRVYTAALAVSAAAAALLVSGCSSDKSDDAAPTTNAPATSQSSPSSPGGASAASVDGKAFEAKFDTTCAKQGDTLALALADLENATYGNLAVSATVTGGNNVQAVGIAGSKGGSNGLPYAVGYGQGAPGGSAKVEVDGKTYHVTGEGVGVPDLTNPTAAPKSSKFDITFVCSTIIGG